LLLKESLKAAATELFRQPNINTENAASVRGNNYEKPLDSPSVSVLSAPSRIGKTDITEGFELDNEKQVPKLPPISMFFPVSPQMRVMHPLPIHSFKVPIPISFAGKRFPAVVLPLPHLTKKRLLDTEKDLDNQENEIRNSPNAEEIETLKKVLFGKSNVS